MRAFRRYDAASSSAWPDGSKMTSRIAAAVDRALEHRQKDANADVERILDAALVVIEQVAPRSPRINDILTHAGVSNTAFYKYFSGKDDLMLALAERGVALVKSYLIHEISGSADPKDGVRRWIEGLFAQVGNPRLAKIDRVVSTHLGASPDLLVAEEEINRSLRDLLADQIALIDGVPNPAVATEAIYALVMGELRRHLILQTMPEAEKIHELIAFCLRGLVGQDVSGRRGKRAAHSRTHARISK